MIAPNWYPDRRQLRQFAVICLFGFALIGLMVWRFTGSVRAGYVMCGIGATATLVGVPFPGAILPLYVLLSGIALPIGYVVSHVMLRLLFYVVITPLGLVFRLMGRDPLRMKRQAGASYWLVRKDRADPLSYYRQA